MPLAFPPTGGGGRCLHHRRRRRLVLRYRRNISGRTAREKSVRVRRAGPARTRTAHRHAGSRGELAVQTDGRSVGFCNHTHKIRVRVRVHTQTHSDGKIIIKRDRLCTYVHSARLRHAFRLPPLKPSPPPPTPKTPPPATLVCTHFARLRFFQKLIVHAVAVHRRFSYLIYIYIYNTVLLCLRLCLSVQRVFRRRFSPQRPSSSSYVLQCACDDRPRHTVTYTAAVLGKGYKKSCRLVDTHARTRVPRGAIPRESTTPACLSYIMYSILHPTLYGVVRHSFPLMKLFKFWFLEFLSKTTLGPSKKCIVICASCEFYRRITFF